MVCCFRINELKEKTLLILHYKMDLLFYFQKEKPTPLLKGEILYYSDTSSLNKRDTNSSKIKTKKESLKLLTLRITRNENDDVFMMGTSFYSLLLWWYLKKKARPNSELFMIIAVKRITTDRMVKNVIFYENT